MSCASPESTEVNIPDSGSTPESTDTVNPTELSLSRHLFDAGMVTVCIYDVYLAILIWIQLFSVFNWIQLCSVIFKIISAVKSLVQIFRRCRSQQCNDSVTQDNNVLTTCCLVLYIYNIGSAVFEIVQAFSFVFSWAQLGSAVFKIFSNGKSLVKILKEYRSQLYSDSVKQEPKQIENYMDARFILLAIFDLRKLGSALCSDFQKIIQKIIPNYAVGQEHKTIKLTTI